MTASKEQYLDDMGIVFKNIFILTDSTMNTSEVQYFHCRLPKTKLTNQRVDQVVPSLAPLPSDSYKQKSRLVDNTQLQPSKIIQEKLEKQVSPPISPVRQETPQEPASPPPKQQNLSPQPRKQFLSPQQPQKQPEVVQEPPKQPSAPPSPVRQSPAKPAAEAKEYDFKESQNKLSLAEYWTIPLRNQETSHFVFYKNINDCGLVDANTKETLIKGSFRGNYISVSNAGEKICEIKQTDDDTYFIFNTEEKPMLEYCAIRLNQSYYADNGPMLFELYIPALKKRPEGQRYVSIETGEVSGLVARIVQKAKEAIAVKSRTPPNSGSTFDLTFDGLFKNPDPHNFIIFHDSSPKRVIASFGCIGPNLYKATVTYPMCPLQLFFACCIVTLK